MKKLILAALALQFIYAGDLPVSFEKEQLLKLKREKIEQETKKDRRSWVSPVILSVSANKSEDAYNIKSTSNNVMLSWNQDLFRSGGIFAVIDRADALKEINLIGVDQEEAGYLKQIYTLKTQYQRDMLKYTKSRLTLQNRMIDFQSVKARYKSGKADIDQLNRVTLDRDNAQTALISIQDLLDNESTLLHKLVGERNISTITTPVITLVSRRDYLKHHLELLQYNAKIKNDDAIRKIANASYLPKVTLNTSLGYSDYERERLTDDGNNYSYGITASMPIDINTHAAKESSKLQYLQTKMAKADRQKEIEKEYRKHLLAIKNFKGKIKIAKEMSLTYQKLYELAEKQEKAGVKTSYDVASLKNSLAIQKLETEIQTYNILIEKITLYFDMKY